MPHVPDKIPLDDLPVTTVLPDLKQALSRGRYAVLEAPPGAGKTTRVPLAVMNEPWILGQKIIMLEPRRLAARSCAAHMACLLGEPVGGQVGYRIRHDHQVSKHTRIEIMTEGLFTRKIQQDPFLEGIGLVIFD